MPDNINLAANKIEILINMKGWAYCGIIFFMFFLIWLMIYIDYEFTTSEWVIVV